MNRLLFTLFMMTLSVYAAFGMGSEDNKPSSPQAQEGKSVYVPINSAINLYEEYSIQKSDQNSTGHGKAK